MTTRTKVLAAARAVAVRDGKCPICLGDLVEYPEIGGVYCQRSMDVVYQPETGEVLGKIS